PPDVLGERGNPTDADTARTTTIVHSLQVIRPHLCTIGADAPACGDPSFSPTSVQQTPVSIRQRLARRITPEGVSRRALYEHNGCERESSEEWWKKSGSVPAELFQAHIHEPKSAYKPRASPSPYGSPGLPRSGERMSDALLDEITVGAG
ncbi:hypothetical protein FRC08_017753, partial [Ceratobasidium sp. 394]